MGAECSTEKICDPDKMLGFETTHKEKDKFNQKRPQQQHASAQYEYNDAMPPRHQESPPYPSVHDGPQPRHPESSYQPMHPESSYQPMHHTRHVDPQSPAQKRQFRVRRLMAAAEQGQFLAIDQVLSESLADRDDIVNEIDEYNDTALHKAARQGHVMACRNLLQHGAQVYRNGEGRTPYEVAVANNRTDCMAFLQLVDKIARSEGDAVAVQSNNDAPPVHIRRNVGPEPPAEQTTNYTTAPEQSYARPPQPAPEPSYTRAAEPAVIVVQSNNEPVMNYAQRESFSEASFSTHKSVAESGPPIRESYQSIPMEQEGAAAAQAQDGTWGNGPTDGVAVVALYDFTGSGEPPFSNDPRLEATMKQGDVFFLVRMRADGWCIVERAARDAEYYVPGNFVSMNGVEPLVIEDETAAVS